MKFESKPIDEHREVPLADDGRIEAIVSSWTDRPNRLRAHGDRNACYVVSAGAWREDAARQGQLAEILGLVRAQGDAVAGHESYQLRRVDPRTFIGKGACARIAERAAAAGADMVVIDAELSPAQMRNMEEATGFPVCDREAVILNVFQRHARTRKARIQVEIAHLEYLRPRIRGIGLVMDQQAGGVMGSRGPGETASELLARQLDGRLDELRKAFARLQRSSEVQRRGRERCRRVALVGYTNAGKTTLMNGLTEAGLSARDMPFETLDTTSRALTRHGGDVLVSDTVGFIRRLPERLLDSFESTLAEARGASLLALVVDAADPEWRLHLETVEELLARLGADAIPRLYVFNKMDLAKQPPTEAAMREAAHGAPCLAICAHAAADVARLKETLIRLARAGVRQAVVFVPYGAAEVLADVYANYRVLEAEPQPQGLRFTLLGDASQLARLRRAARKVPARA